MEFNLRSGSASLQKDVQGLLCQLTRYCICDKFGYNVMWMCVCLCRDNLDATCNLNEFIMQRVLQHIKPQRTSPNLVRNGWQEMDGWMDRLIYVLINRESINGYCYETNFFIVGFSYSSWNAVAYCISCYGRHMLGGTS